MAESIEVYTCMFAYMWLLRLFSQLTSGENKALWIGEITEAFINKNSFGKCVDESESGTVML